MSDPMILPLEALSDACASQLLIVRREWPLGVPLTPLTAQRAVELGLDLEWIVGHLLDDLAWAEFERVRAKAKADYERVTAPAWADYTRVTVKAWAKYRRATAPALLDGVIQTLKRRGTR